MREVQKFEGDWWVPNESGHEVRRVVGTLDFEPDRFVLKTYGRLDVWEFVSDEGGTSVFADVDVPVIWGESRHSPERYTLLDANGYVASPSFSATGDQQWRPTTALVGAHLTDATRYDLIRLQVDHLDEWAGVGRLSHSVTRDRAGFTDQIEISAEGGELETATIPGIGTVRVLARPVWTISGRESDLSVVGVVEIEPEEAVTLREVLSRVHLLRSFIRLCVGHPVGLTNVWFRPEGAKDTVEVLQRYNEFNGDSVGPIARGQMLLWRGALPGGLFGSLSQWAELNARHEQAWFRVTSMDFVRRANIDDAFVSYASALEAIHGRGLPQNPDDDPELTRRVEECLAFIPEEHREWAEAKFRRNGIDFRQRIVEVIDSTGAIGADLFGVSSAEVARRVVPTRNVLTHINTERRSTYIKSADLRFYVGRALHFTALAYFLLQLGVDPVALRDAFGRHSEASRMKTNLQRLSNPPISRLSPTS